MRPGGVHILGLSPRVRGKLLDILLERRIPRSIPACAGEADKREPGNPALQVYPRVCGGSGGALFAATGKRGLSPRVRGKRR